MRTGNVRKNCQQQLYKKVVRYIFRGIQARVDGGAPPLCRGGGRGDPTVREPIE